ncbi:Protein of unknown function (DUF3093) [Glaciihabitans tibetensis]|uniref:DUF3093 family protein n=1 Tax=Glaciihabitans tibetensis TaxID=1266600 RepID=A0A2T0VJE0_9MICO|nr:DUF3093 domain-containing protein [Glaciihabitans tibetensis]PRY70324.1 Protein of unknown function (DUF3093) [Glaciihabitans tibetensis]
MTIYRERLLPGPWTFIVTALVIPASLLVFLPINAFVGVVSAIVLYSALVVALVVLSPVIEVTDTALVAGRARVPLELVGSAAAFTGEEARQQRGPVLDARAWLVIRGWVDPVVKVEILDDRDPAPYWLVSTRQPAAMVSAVAKAQTLR